MGWFLNDRGCSDNPIIPGVELESPVNNGDRKSRSQPSPAYTYAAYRIRAKHRQRILCGATIFRHVYESISLFIFTTPGRLSMTIILYAYSILAGMDVCARHCTVAQDRYCVARHELIKEPT